MSMHESIGKPLLRLGVMDHYTLIVKDAEAVANFHIQSLGFKLKEKKCINTGTVEPPDYDMINLILTLPENPEVFCVVTQGTNEQTVFSKYLSKYGSGIHHIAYQVDNITENWQICLEQGLNITSEEIIFDPLTGLKQFFISRDYSGYFIEIIERTTKLNAESDHNFTENNMKKLSDSIKPFVGD